MNELQVFLQQYEVYKGSDFSHTCLKNHKSYLITVAHHDEFYEKYKKTYGNSNLALTEKHREQCPILIDFDFRQTTNDRLYTKDHIIAILQILLEFLDDYVDCSQEPEIFVLEKPPRQSKNQYKDGLHIIIPSIVTTPTYQLLMREKCMEKIWTVIQNCGFTNTITEIYDEAVIARNNWFMYGSKKPDEPIAWEVSYVFSWKNMVIMEKDDIDYSTDDLIELFSIRNKFDFTSVKIDLPEMAETVSICDSSQQSNIRNIYDRDLIINLVNILKIQRADNYTSWMEVGWCLHNIDPYTLCDVWTMFSQRSAKYKTGECERLWDNMRNSGLGAGSLHKWAKEDDPEKYQDIINNSVSKLIDIAASGTQTDIAKIAYYLAHDRFTCASIKNNTWYEFVNNKWTYIENAHSLRHFLSTDIFEFFQDRAKFHKDIAKEKAKDLLKVANKLKFSNFKDGIIKECTEIFYDKYFLEKADNNTKLIGFNNGVYDLTSHEFRYGKYDDYITMTTKYDFATADDLDVQDDIMKFVTSIMPNAEMAQYILKVLAYMLDGEKHLEQLWFFTGSSGRNGKSSICNLMQNTLGEYYYEPDITIITTSRKSSSSANPDVAKSKGKRMLVGSEPDDSSNETKIKANVIKQLSGRDMVQARELYKSPIEFRPQFGMVFLMNDRPKLSKLDDAIGKRLKIINFPFQFVEQPTLEFQKKIDFTLKTKFESDVRYRQQMMRLLVKYHKEFVHGNQAFVDPPEVTAETNEYMNDNNPVSVWLNNNYDFTNSREDKVLVSDLYREYMSQQDLRSSETKERFGKLMSMIGFKSVSTTQKRFYFGLRKKTIVEELE